MQNVAHALKTARVRAGFTQKQVAEALGITPQFVNDLEHARRAFTEKYVPLLPDSMRYLVAAAMTDEHQAAIERLQMAAQ